MLSEAEVELQPSASYLEQHGPGASPELYLDASMRRTAASWLVEVAAEFGLHQETLFLATALLDRFLSTARVCAGPRALLSNAVLQVQGAAGGSLQCSGLETASCQTTRLPRIIATAMCCRACPAHSCSWLEWPACSSRPSMKR